MKTLNNVTHSCIGDVIYDCDNTGKIKGWDLRALHTDVIYQVFFASQLETQCTIIFLQYESNSVLPFKSHCLKYPLN
jgi:hypothetical protein